MTMALSNPQHKNRSQASQWQPLACLPALFGWLALLTWSASVSYGQTPLYEQRPFDRIILDAANDNMVLDVLPLDSEFPDRKLPEKLRTSGKLIVEPINEPGTQYECYWRSVAKIELFEQLILNEVNGLVRAKRFEDAYQYFVQLMNEKPDLPGLQAAFDDYLYEEAKAFHVAGQYDAALARLREIYQRTPQRSGLDVALGAATEMLVDKQVKAKQYWIARGFLDNLAKQHADHPVVAKWRGKLQQMAGEHLAVARRFIDEGRLREAHASIRQIAAVWPDLPGVEEVRNTIAMRYPRYVVGVESPAMVNQPGRIDDWASRRSGRLVERTLMEFVGPGTEGGKYLCPVGDMKAENLGRQLEFSLRTDVSVAGGDAVLTGYDLARQFLEMADPDSSQYFQLWGDLFESVTVEDVFGAVTRLRRPFVLPQALLQTSIATKTSSFGGVEAGATIGPYYVDATKDDHTVFLSNTSYFAGGTSRPKEIVEQRFSSGHDLATALRRGDIDVVDRLNLWELEKFREIRGVQVKRYSVPLVHCLIPNPKRPLSSRRAFRRALVYGINREAILNLLVHSQDIPGCRVISGPFSAGVTIDDPLDYAYDNSILPRTYEPHLAVALAEVALTEYLEAEKKKQESTGEPAKEDAKEAPAEPVEEVAKAPAKEAAEETGDEAAKKPAKEAAKAPVKIPETILAHPATETARMAVQQIKRQLKLIGIEVQTREHGPDLPNRIPEDVDLLYAELAMWEPIVDAERLLGEDGMIGEVSPYMRQALMRLRQSVDWPTVGRQLRDIHQRAHSEVTIIPLWQLSDYFAHVRDLEGLGDSPVTLYQYVEDWRARPQTTAKKK